MPRPRRRRRGLLLAESAEQDVRERAVHRLGHVDRQDEARGSVERPGDDQQLVVEHESHGGGRKAGVGVSSEITVGMSAPPMGMIISTPKISGITRITGKSQVFSGKETRWAATKMRDDEQRKIDVILALEGDRPLGQDFLELSRGHQASGEGQRAKDHFDRDHDMVNGGTSGARR